MELARMDIDVVLWAGLVLYVMGCVSAIKALMLENKYLKLLFWVLVGGGFLLQGMGLYVRGIQLGVLPLRGPKEILQVISWSSILLVVIVEIFFRLRLLALFGVGLASILGVISLLLEGMRDDLGTRAVLSNPWIEFHALLALFAYGTFGILAMIALMYVMQDYGLVNKCCGRIFSLLPSLKQLDALSRHFLLLGVVLLTLAVGMGTLSWLHNLGAVGLGKMLSVWGLWFCYLSVLWLKEGHQWNARYYSWMCVVLFVFVILSLWSLHNQTLV